MEEENSTSDGFKDLSENPSEKPIEKLTEEQLKHRPKPKENFFSRMINIWKNIMMDPKDFFENPPEIGWMLAFIITNFAITIFSIFFIIWVFTNSNSKSSDIPFGSTFADLFRGFFIGGVILIISLFIIAGLVLLMNKVFGSKKANYISVFDIISIPIAISIFLPIIILISFITSYIPNRYVVLIITLSSFAAIYIFVIYSVYLVIAGLKKVCNISGLKASASWIIAIFVFFITLVLIFQPNMDINDLSLYPINSNQINNNIKGQKDYEDLLEEYNQDKYDYDSDDDYDWNDDDYDDYDYDSNYWD